MINDIKSEFNLKKFLIYVLLATICDVMPLRKLNRSIAINALNEFNINDFYSFKKIFDLNKKKNKININDLGFLIGPTLNAGGRLGKSNYATKLLINEDRKILDHISSELYYLNNKRRKIEDKILENIDFSKLENNKTDIIIYYDSNMNEGLIGIIASRLKDYFNKPSFVITNSNDLLKGSCRSTEDYNIGKIVKKLYDKKIILNGGGHHMAAGFTLDKDKLNSFKEEVSKEYNKKNTFKSNIHKFDTEISSTSLNYDLINEINKIQPCGPGNPFPIFFLKDLKVLKSKSINNKHISCVLKSKIGKSVNSISFNSANTKVGNYLINYKKYFNVIGQIQENNWNNKKSLQLIIIDIIL